MAPSGRTGEGVVMRRIIGPALGIAAATVLTLAAAGPLAWPVTPTPAASAADVATPGLDVAGNQLLRDGVPFQPDGFNMIGLLTPAWCVRPASQGARDHFGQAEMDAALAWHANTDRKSVV